MHDLRTQCAFSPADEGYDGGQELIKVDDDTKTAESSTEAVNERQRGLGSRSGSLAGRGRAW